ncbi:MAG: hypothetical protein M1827_001500 [Pycnora praestabilis]|nr:MAG: hypothetical protein M1827_001500 [Pycnora praestabilis]
MASRSFLYPLRPTTHSAKQMENDAATITQPRSPLKEETDPLGIRPSVKTSMSSPPPLSPSRPVVIPTRNHTGGPREIHGLHDRSQINTKSSRSTSATHNPGSIPPAVAALLAVTSIPPLKSGKVTRWRSDRNYIQPSILSLLDGSQVEEKGIAMSAQAKSPLDLLLSSPEELDEGELSFDSESTIEPVLSVRSTSSESVPSLDTDDESTASFSSPSTPGRRRRGESTDRKGKVVSSPPAEECAFDHPLLTPTTEAAAFDFRSCAGEGEPVIQNVHDLPIRTKYSFKSNLTASLRVLKSAAISLSNFTAPSVPPDDYLTRSILSISPRNTDERRPKPLEDLPTPALRRYLNPINNSQGEMHSHTKDFRKPARGDKPTAMIQLQTYQRSTKTGKKGSSSLVGDRRSAQKGDEDPFLQASLIRGPVARQREPRENSDFLRVIVMEMNMRREGKLSDSAHGRAKIWLPPRQPGKKYAVEDNGIPSRWVGVVIEHDS